MKKAIEFYISTIRIKPAGGNGGRSPTPANEQIPRHLLYGTLYDIRECNAQLPVLTLLLLRCPGNDLVSHRCAKGTAQHRRWHTSVPNVTLRCAPGRGRYFHCAWWSSGMSLSKPARDLEAREGGG